MSDLFYCHYRFICTQRHHSVLGFRWRLKDYIRLEIIFAPFSPASAVTVTSVMTSKIIHHCPGLGPSDDRYLLLSASYYRFACNVGRLCLRITSGSLSWNNFASLMIDLCEDEDSWLFISISSGKNKPTIFLRLQFHSFISNVCGNGWDDSHGCMLNSQRACECKEEQRISQTLSFLEIIRYPQNRCIFHGKKWRHCLKNV